MIKLTARRGIRFSIMVIVFGIVLLFSTSFFPWIAFQDSGNGQKEFHLNFEMMKNSNYPEIKSIANQINIINMLLWFTIIIGLISLLSVCYHSSTKSSNIGYFLMITANIFMIVIAFLIVFLFFSVIGYISVEQMIYLSSPFPLFSYSFISLIGSVIFLIISVMYGGFITFCLFIEFKNKKDMIFPANDSRSDDEPIQLEKWRSDKIKGLFNINEKDDKLLALSKERSEKLEKDLIAKSKESEPKIFSFNESYGKTRAKEKGEKDQEEEIFDKSEPRISEPFSFDKSHEKVQEKKIEDVRVSSPFYFNKSYEKGQKKDLEIDINSFRENISDSSNNRKAEIKESEFFKTLKDFKKEEICTSKPDLEISVEIKDVPYTKKQEQAISEKKTLKVRCPQCKHIFSAEKSGDATPIKCPYCSKEGVIK